MHKLKVLSFNILAEQFIDYSDLSADYPDVPKNVLIERNRLPKIFAFLKKIDADILMLQEVNPKVYKLLKQQFSTNYTIYPLAKHKTAEAQQKGNTYGNLIMTRKHLAKNTTQNIYHVPMLGTAFAVLECTLFDRPSLIINVHLDAEPTEKNRRTEVTVLMALLGRFMKTHVTILSGDFNTSNSKTHKKFTGLRSVVSKYKGTYLADEAMIDWIYVKNALILDGKVFKPANATAATPLVKYGSDHYPILGIISIRSLEAMEAKWKSLKIGKKE